MRLLLTALTCPKGEVEENLARHLAILEQGEGCDLVLLPEMSLTGYRPSAAIAIDHPAVRELVAKTTSGPAVCFGLVEVAAGKPHITQVVASGGDVVVVHRKAHLGDDETDDFQPGTPAGRFDLAGIACSIAVCAEIGSQPPYRQGSRVVLGPAAPGLYGERRLTEGDWRRGFDWWRGSVRSDAARFLLADQWLAVSTQAGATDDEDFPGWAALIGPGDGDVAVELPDWQQGTLIVDVPR